MSERPEVCVCSLRICALALAPKTSRMPMAQMRRQTRAEHEVFDVEAAI
jgi:hypothetical protein